jgi:hypothetical protein
MVGDLSEIDTLIYTTLANDQALKALLPDGVAWDVAPAATAFGILSRSDGEHVNALANEDGWDRVTYTAKAVIASSSVAQASNAAYRIHELLERGLQDAEAGNYRVMHIERVLPIRYTEVDPKNTAARWQHHGGQYSVMVSPL